MSVQTILQAENISRIAPTESGDLIILNDVSIQVQTGETVAIQGASGSGKSTLLSLLAGLELPQRGQVSFLGHVMSELNEDQRADLRANKVGFVFQSFYLVDELTALENVALPLELFAHSGAPNVAREWLSRFGLADRLSYFPKKLSGGEQQRVALARAFAINPTLLLADEPTANLDSHTANSVLDYLFEWQRTNGTTMVIATHDDSLASRCDRIIRLDAGCVMSVENTEARNDQC